MNRWPFMDDIALVLHHVQIVDLSIEHLRSDVFLSIAIIGTITWLAILEHNYHPRIYRYNNQVTILQVGDSELDFNHPERTFGIWWQSARRNMRVWAR